MKDLTIRAATPNDSDLLAGLNAEVQQLHATHRPEDFKAANVGELALWFADLLKKRSVAVWIAEGASTPVGYALVMDHRTPETTFCKARRWWELDQLGVAAEHRRQGVGRALVRKVVAEAQSQGIPYVELQTWAFNQDAQAAFRQLGFTPKRVRYELRVDASNASAPAS